MSARRITGMPEGERNVAVAVTATESEDCLACLSFPASHQRRIRTTNGLERVNQELKRRTRVVRIFPNRAAVIRLVQSDSGAYRFDGKQVLRCRRPLTESAARLAFASELLTRLAA